MNDKQWRKKVNRARYVERNIVKWIKRKFDNKAALVNGYFPDYDIISLELGNVEVKEDRMAHKTGNYAIEYKCNGKPSGIERTKAKTFILVDWENVIVMATETLKFMLSQMKYKRTVEMGDRFNTGLRAEGYLIPVEKILNSPMATVYKRWFPVLQEDEVRTS